MSDYIIRSATPDDAPAFNDHLRRIADEPHNMISYSHGEFERTVEEDRERIINILNAENSKMFVAVADGKMIGFCAAYGGVRGARYSAIVAITVHIDWRSQGVGTALMKAIIAWALENPIMRRLELDVYTHNERAIHVYEKLGFPKGRCSQRCIFQRWSFR